MKIYYALIITALAFIPIDSWAGKGASRRLLQQGLDYNLVRQEDKALMAFLDAIDEYPKNYEAHAQAAAIFTRRGDCISLKDHTKALKKKKSYRQEAKIYTKTCKENAKSGRYTKSSMLAETFSRLKKGWSWALTVGPRFDSNGELAANGEDSFSAFGSISGTNSKTGWDGGIRTVFSEDEIVEFSDAIVTSVGKSFTKKSGFLGPKGVTQRVGADSYYLDGDEDGDKGFDLFKVSYTYSAIRSSTPKGASILNMGVGYNYASLDDIDGATGPDFTLGYQWSFLKNVSQSSVGVDLTSNFADGGGYRYHQPTIRANYLRRLTRKTRAGVETSTYYRYYPDYSTAEAREDANVSLDLVYQLYLKRANRLNFSLGGRKNFSNTSAFRYDRLVTALTYLTQF